MLQIKKMRLAVGMTQAELAKGIGVTRSAVALWETGRKYPRSRDIPQLASLLHCTIDELYARDSPERIGEGTSPSSA